VIADATRRRQEADAQAQQLKTQLEQAQQQAQAAAQQSQAELEKTRQQALQAQAELERTRQELAQKEAEARKLRMQQELSQLAQRDGTEGSGGDEQERGREAAESQSRISDYKWLAATNLRQPRIVYPVNRTEVFDATFPFSFSGPSPSGQRHGDGARWPFPP